MTGAALHRIDSARLAGETEPSRAQALCGPAAGTELRRLPVIETTWGHWKSLYPNSTVLALNTGYPLQYGRYPYGDYDERDNDALLFPRRWCSPARPPKELVLGVSDGTPGSPAVAYPFGVLATMGSFVTVNDPLNAKPLLRHYVEAANTARSYSRLVDGRTLTFAVSGTHAGTLVDSETASTWNGLGQAIAGPLLGERLEPTADAYTLFSFA